MKPLTGITAYIGLGSNQGDRLHALQHACDLLAAVPGITLEALSPVYASESVEGGGNDTFLNAAVRIQTTLPARELLTRLQAIETTLGRPAPPRQGSRIIDLDLLLYGEQRIETPLLTVPHPRLAYRLFVLRPLCDVLLGGWVTPVGQRLLLPDADHESCPMPEASSVGKSVISPCSAGNSLSESKHYDITDCRSNKE